MFTDLIEGHSESHYLFQKKKTSSTMKVKKNETYLEFQAQYSKFGAYFMGPTPFSEACSHWLALK